MSICLYSHSLLYHVLFFRGRLRRDNSYNERICMQVIKVHQSDIDQQNDRRNVCLYADISFIFLRRLCLYFKYDFMSMLQHC